MKHATGCGQFFLALLFELRIGLQLCMVFERSTVTVMVAVCIFRSEVVMKELTIH